MMNLQTRCSAFEAGRRMASGPLQDVAVLAKQAMDRKDAKAVLVFDDATSDVVELDWRGSSAEFRARLDAWGASLETAQSTGALQETTVGMTRGPGRPKLGVVAREVTLLPRHWEWLAAQPGGASVALRKLVDGARRATEGGSRVREKRAIAYKFMVTLAGHESGFEEASRALFAGNEAAFKTHTSAWPADVQAHLLQLLAGTFEPLNHEE